MAAHDVEELSGSLDGNRRSDRPARGNDPYCEHARLSRGDDLGATPVGQVGVLADEADDAVGDLDVPTAGRRRAGVSARRPA
jgi:hypothetical protein